MITEGNKQKRSAYLREVKAGVRILLTDRNQVVAELTRPNLSNSYPSEVKPLILQANEGKVTLATTKHRKPARSPVKVTEPVSDRLLDE